MGLPTSYLHNKIQGNPIQPPELLCVMRAGPAEWAIGSQFSNP